MQLSHCSPRQHQLALQAGCFHALLQRAKSSDQEKGRDVPGELSHGKGPVLHVSMEELLGPGATVLFFPFQSFVAPGVGGVPAPVDEAAGEDVEPHTQEAVDARLNQWPGAPVQPRALAHPQLLDEYAMQRDAEGGGGEDGHGRTAQLLLCCLHWIGLRVHHAEKPHHCQDKGDHHQAKHPLRSVDALPMLDLTQVLLLAARNTSRSLEAGAPTGTNPKKNGKKSRRKAKTLSSSLSALGPTLRKKNHNKSPKP